MVRSVNTSDVSVTVREYFQSGAQASRHTTRYVVAPAEAVQRRLASYPPWLRASSGWPWALIVFGAAGASASETSPAAFTRALRARYAGSTPSGVSFTVCCRL